MRLAPWQGRFPAAHLDATRAKAALAAAAAMGTGPRVLTEDGLPGSNTPDSPAQALTRDCGPMHLMSMAASRHCPAGVVSCSRLAHDPAVIAARPSPQATYLRAN